MNDNTRSILINKYFNFINNISVTDEDLSKIESIDKEFNKYDISSEYLCDCIIPYTGQFKLDSRRCIILCGGFVSCNEFYKRFINKIR